MVKNKKSLWFAGILSICASLMLATITTSVIAFSMSLNETATNNADFYVDLNDDGKDDLGCYITTNAVGDAHGGVAIAWAGSKSATKNAELNLTKTFSFLHEGKYYDLTGVAYGGFRYTLFDRVLLPTTVTELGKEAFAYCTNLKSFMLPSEVTSIPASCFLDCRDLESFTYYNGIAHHLYEYDGEESTWVEITSILTGEGAPEGDLDSAKPYLDTENLRVYTYSGDSWGSGVQILLSGEERPNQRTDIVSPAGYYYRFEYHDSIVNDIASFTIEDHAFDSCVSLRTFVFPKNLSAIGESAFQRCSSFTKIYLPTENNNLTVAAYAFCDCKLLSWVYFERNLKDVGNYAFANCHENLIFHYGQKEGGTVTKSTIDTKFITTNNDLPSASWRNKYLSASKTAEEDKIDFETNKVTHFRPDDHPELIYSIETEDITLNCQRGNGDTIYLDTSGTPYLVIHQWTPPKESTPNYYDAEKGELEIPGSVTVNETAIPVKVIGEEAFTDQSVLTKVKFNDGLVQIRKKAFYRCTSIYSFDMSALTTLKEISNSIFNDVVSGMTNSDDRARSLSIPASVEYIGSYAFYGFTKVTSLDFHHETSRLKVLGGYSFARIGESYNAGVVDIILPCTLDDSAAKQANINEETIINGKQDFCIENWAALGPYCFGCSNPKDLPGTHSGVRSVTIDTCDHSHTPSSGSDAFSTSLAPNAFARAKYLIRFMANKNLCYIGVDSFKECASLKEMFLATERSESSEKDYPWGTRDAGDTYDANGIFSGNTAPKDLVIYLDNEGLGGKRAPGRTDEKAWYSESANTYAHEADGSFSRSSIPVVDNVAFGASKTAVLYWLPGASGGTFLSEPPTSPEQYNGTALGCTNGMIVLAQTGTYDGDKKEYTAVKYFYDSSKDAPLSEIDLSSISLTATYTVTENGSPVNKPYWVSTNHVVDIGDEAFASDNGKKRGLYFILPDTIETISERAFYRSSSDSGVRIITYKDGANPHGDYTAAKADSSKHYCDLPTTLTRVERNAFYGNSFTSAKINSNLSFLGKSAFYSSSSQLAETSITSASSTLFGNSGNGLYYIGASKRALLYQAQNISGTLDLSGDTNLKAIGMNAVSKTLYSAISLPTSLTHIYGGGFQNNTALTTVTIPSGSLLQYISEYSADDGYWNASLPFDIIDYSNKVSDTEKLKRSQGRAFKGCASLTTLNFKNLTHLEKIGPDAFNGCSALDNMVNGTGDYKYYKNGTSSSVTPADKKGILDLSHLNGANSNAQLLSIGAGAFSGCTQIKYIHLPSSSSNLVIAGNAGISDSSGKIIDDNKGINVLVGEKAIQACSTASGIAGLDDIRKRYNTTCFGNGNNIYYYAENDGDLLTGSNTGVKYWTRYGVTDGFVLLDGYNNAVNYLPSN
ncbi:MAG: leucine-rich repeat protein [Bacilli bacterium]|nr:leucine-rich repeat protein [Bacilli bacterium]